MTAVNASVLLSFNTIENVHSTSSTLISSSNTTSTESLKPPTKKSRIESSIFWDCVDEIVQSTPTEQQHISAGIESELCQYLSEPVVSRTEDPLKWWKYNKERFPSLAKVARVYLGSPPTSVPSERLFSVAGEVQYRTIKRGQAV